MEQITQELKQTIEKIKSEIQQSRSFNLIKVKSYDIVLDEIPICKKILYAIVSQLNLNIVNDVNSSEYQMTIVASFNDSLEKLYEFTIHVDEDKDDILFFLEITRYLKSEHKSLFCNWNKEWIGTLLLNEKTMEDIFIFINEFRGKKKTVYCNYCGEINFEQ
jgi:hypothetical protein